MSYIIKIDLEDFSLPYETKRETIFNCDYKGKLLTQKMPKGTYCTVHFKLSASISLPEPVTKIKIEKEVCSNLIDAFKNLDITKLTPQDIASQIKLCTASVAQVKKSSITILELSLKRWLENGYFGNALLSTRKKEIIPQTVDPVTL